MQKDKVFKEIYINQIKTEKGSIDEDNSIKEIQINYHEYGVSKPKRKELIFKISHE